jgi:uncharacterized RDD family membrane protein YckC
VDSEQLRIVGLTGIELNLPIAGPGSRSYAFVIDWHIRLLIALAWLLCTRLVLAAVGISGTSGARTANALMVVLPALLIFFLYHPVLELLMHGRTPGKRMAGVRLVTQQGGLPGAGAILTRNIFRVLDCLPAFYLVGLSSCMISTQRLRIGDMAAGTVLVLDTTEAVGALTRVPALLAHSGLDPRLAELINELLDRWPSLSSERRGGLARQLLARVNPAEPSAALQALDDAELQRRLRALVTAQA